MVDAAAERARAHDPTRPAEPPVRPASPPCAPSTRAADAGHLTTNPAAALSKPTRTRSRRRALDDRELTGLANAVRATSTDPDLDLLLLRFHLETGSRRQGAPNLRVRDIDSDRARVWLREKNDTEREQPASPAIVSLLLAHAAERGGDRADEAVFRNRRAEPISGRRYDRLFARAVAVLTGEPHPLDDPSRVHVRRTCSNPWR